jgi:hypothetical protein
MNVPKTSNELKNEIYISVDKSKDIGDLRIRQLIKILSNVPDEIILEGIISVFESEQREKIWYYDQEFSGQVLKNIKPKSKVEPIDILKRVLKNWDVCVEELPIWFKENYGIDLIIEALDRLNNFSISDFEKDKIKTMKFWIKNK